MEIFFFYITVVFFIGLIWFLLVSKRLVRGVLRVFLQSIA